MFQAGTVPGREHSREVKDVMSVIKKKLKSDRGASITYALLIFLVCAIIGSAVLTAGTAASGRLSQMVEIDQRYYSVNSAASLLIDLMERDKIVYEQPDTTTEDTNSDDDQNGDQAGDTGADGGDALQADSYTYYVNGEEAASTGSLPLSLALAKQVLKMSGNTPSDLPLNLTLNSETETDLEGANLEVSGTVTITKKEVENSADLVFEIKDKDEKYAVRIYMINQTPPPRFEWSLDHIESIRWDREEDTALSGSG